ncbi:MAG: HEPN domain-containing protein [Candidatus Brocadiia bacterium]
MSTAEEPQGNGTRAPASLGPEGIRRLFGQIISLYVRPEIEKRQDMAKLFGPFHLWAAQIIFSLTGGPPAIRLNQEVRARVQVSLTNGSQQEVGPPPSLRGIQDIEDVIGVQEELENKDCAHITLVYAPGRWLIVFDARYNKHLARRHIRRAGAFLAASENCFEHRLWAPLVDNLFSAAELAAKATMMTVPDGKLRRGVRHQYIRMRYDAWAQVGNTAVPFSDTLNKLTGMRDRGRYLKGEFKLPDAEARELLQIVRAMLRDAKNRLGMGQS